MSDIREHVAYLSQTIGPRPAGTEEEQQAALYITEKLQQEAGLPAVIEDFNCNPDYDLPRALCCGVTAIIAIVAMIVPVMTIPALILTLLSAVVFALESFGKPVVSRFLTRGVSQNVVAKYEPAGATGTRRRKIVLVAHYDSGKVNKEVSGPLFKVITQVRWAALGGMIVVPVLFLIRTLIAFGGTGLIVMNVVTGIALLCALIPLIVMAMHRGAAYNESANCNAAGVAVMMDVAARVTRAAEEASAFEAGEGDSADSARAAVMHGAEAAMAEGLVPDSAEFVYEDGGSASAYAEEIEESPAARLASAKAAIAALTGQPVSTTINIDFPEEDAYTAPADDLYDAVAYGAGEADTIAFGSDDAAFGSDGFAFGASADAAAGSAGSAESAAAGASAGSAASAASGESSFVEGIVADIAAGAAAALAVEAAEETAAEALAAEAAALAAAKAAEEAASSVPAWFRDAQAKAKKPAADAAPIQRSRYADALDAAHAQSAAQAEVAAAAPFSIGSAAGSASAASGPASSVSAVSGTFAASSSSAAPADELSETERRLQQMRESIMQVKAPVADRSYMEPAAEPSAAAAAAATAAPTDEQAAKAEAAESAAPASATQPQPKVVVPAVQPTADPAAEADLGATRAFKPVPVDLAEMEREAAAITAEPKQRKQPTPRARRAIALPSITGLTGQNEPVVAPEAAAQEESPLEPTRTGRVRSLRSVLPSIADIAAEAPAAAAATAAAAPAAADAAEAAPVEPQAAPAASAELDDPFAPKPIEAYQDEEVAAAEAYEDDFEGGYEEPQGYEDEYAEDDEYFEEDDFAAGYVEMPKSRFARFAEKFRFGRKKEEPAQSSPQEWLDLDEEFDARSAGKARGGWESFRQEETDAYAEDFYGEDEYDAYDPYASYGNTSYGNDAYGDDAYAEDAYADDAYAEDAYEAGTTTQFQPVDSWGEEGDFEETPRRSARRAGKRRWHGGSFSREQLGRASEMADDYAAAEAYAEEAYDGYEAIEAFHNGAITTEVWFVALGSELAANGGMSAFVAEHASELKGAIFIELEGLGAGDLSLIEKEGLYTPRAASSRMKRYARKAASEIGASVFSGTILWKDGPAAYALKHGYQAMHLAGMTDGKPAFFGQPNDMLENISDEVLQTNSDFVMEILKQI